MKIRSGFVSNSSSSSFILAISEEKNCDQCGYNSASMIDLVANMFGTKEFTSSIPSEYNGDPESFIESIDYEIEELDKDIKWAIEKVEILKKVINADDDIISLFDQWDELKNKTETRFRRMTEEADKQYYVSASDSIKNDIDSLKWTIEDKANKKLELQNKKKKIETVVGSGRTIYVFKIDYHAKGNAIVSNLIDNGMVEVIERINS